jgi:enamine deaminase RidA (YjgF/YER057c/UK114 family)
MPTFFNPATAPAPASSYSQGVVHAPGGGGRRLIVSGQIGVRLDGSIAEGLEAQMEVAWDNLVAVVRAAGMDVADIVKVTTFVTAPNAVALARAVRRRKLGDHAPASTYLQVAGLASPDFLFEVEAEAIREPTG